VNQIFPTLLTDAATYDRDLFDILTMHEKVFTTLSQRPEFQKANQDRPLFTYELQSPSEEQITVRRLDPKIAPEWRRTLLQVIEPIEKAYAESSAASVLQQSLRSLIAERNLGQAQGFLTGLIQALPAEFKGEAFKMSFQEQLSLLEKHLPESLEKSAFSSRAVWPM
jgi:hypothetical protein